ncbi:LytR/AlgR family response regulator transcription factor [Methylomicrobium lacus]|uniref:LytR/AlgR family response regulator transcription factor n=1 Tax=Methylomicrobium lacus TaxID=136992 RepID=UPI0035A8EA45
MVRNRRVIIVDDEALARDELAAMLHSRHLDIEVIGAVDGTVKAWELVQADDAIEGIFLDIDIQTESRRAGLDFALNLQRLEKKPWIVFVTGYREHAVEAFQSFPVNYLVKPVDNAAIDRTLDWVRRNFPSAKSEAERLAVRHRIDDPSGEKLFCTEYLDPDEVLYVQKNNGVNTVKIGLVSGGELDGIDGTLKEWKMRGFFQIHRRNLINLQHARRLEPRIGENNVYKIVFKNSPVKLDIGPDFLPALRERLKAP